MASKVDNAKRLRYIRVLERFSHSIVTYLLKSENISKEAYDKKVLNNLRYLERVESIALYKGEYNELEKLIKQMIAFKESDKEIDDIKETLLYQFNQIEKSINNRRYKKDKHVGDKYKDWE
ncbi:MAG: hypothetical protein U9R50_02045 [Campylobacterota bacterium]|nr:hypothetical protein [Campylobacterota bacterium]